MLGVALFFALLVGVTLGLLGGGGSILTVPILRYVLGMEGHSAIATSLLVVGVTSVAALLAHARQGRVQWQTGLWFGSAGMFGSYSAARVAQQLPAPLLLTGFSLMMFGTATAMLRPARGARDIVTRPRGRRASVLRTLEILLQGLVVGALTGLVGAGGGFLVVPALVLLGRLPMTSAIGTALLVIALGSFAGLAGHVGHTAIDWQVALVISLFSVLGSFAGARLAGRLSPQHLRRGFGWFALAMAFFILAREGPLLAGLTPSVIAAVATSLAGTTLVAVVRRRLGRQRDRSAARAGGSLQVPAPSGAPLASKLERKLS